MDGIMFLMGVIVGVITLTIISCVSVGSDETPYDKQKGQTYNFYELSIALFATLIYYMSDSIKKETIINYISNAIKISINKGLIELKEDNVQIHDCAESIYENVMDFFDKGDI